MVGCEGKDCVTERAMNEANDRVEKIGCIGLSLDGVSGCHDLKLSHGSLQTMESDTKWVTIDGNRARNHVKRDIFYHTWK